MHELRQCSVNGGCLVYKVGLRWVDQDLILNSLQCSSCSWSLASISLGIHQTELQATISGTVIRRYMETALWIWNATSVNSTRPDFRRWVVIEEHKSPQNLDLSRADNIVSKFWRSSDRRTQSPQNPELSRADTIHYCLQALRDNRFRVTNLSTWWCEDVVWFTKLIAAALVAASSDALWPHLRTTDAIWPLSI